MVDNKKVEAVKKISIPDYFDKVIIPEMGDYYSDYTVNFEYKPVVKCPIHGEDTPSLRYYDETNTFYCFGCGSGGDIISLHRLFYKVINGDTPTFEDSVTFLYTTFIENNKIITNNTQRKINKQIQTVENSNSDLIRLNVYIKDLEDKLLIDNKIDIDKKTKIYNEIDNIIILTSLSLIKVDNGIKHIKEFMGGILR